MTQDKTVKVEAARPPEEQSEDTFTPLVDIYETGNELVVVAELPGAGEDDIVVRVDKGVLTIEARAKFPTPGAGYARTFVSFEPGQYFRAFALSDEVDRERITASVANGVLTVHLPKAEVARTRKIEIKSAE